MEKTDRVYIVTDRKSAGKRFFEIIENLVLNGLTFIQLREKDLSAIELYQLGKKLQEICKGKELRLVINDRIDVAIALKAYGVQLTEGSLTPDIVKSISKRVKIGLSVHNRDRLQKYKKLADFFVFGNIFNTESKPGLVGQGVFALKDLSKLSNKPLYAIGGINSSNMHIVLRAGAYGVAMRGAFFSNENFIEEINKIRKALEKIEGAN